MLQEKLIATRCITQAIYDYRSSNTIVKDLDVETYLDSKEFELHCVIAELPVEETRKRIKACKNDKKKSDYISIKVMSLYFDFDYETAYWWCFQNRQMSFSRKRKTTRVNIDQAKLLLEHMRESGT